MKWFLLTSIFVCFIAIILTVVPLRDQVVILMRSPLQSTLTQLTRRALTSYPLRRTMSSTTQFVGLPVVPANDPSLTTTTPKCRSIAKVFEAIEQAEGAGATVRRSIGTPKLRNLSPFLLLDHFSVVPGAGFPDHPHRGQETITYLFEGAVDHEDFAGNKGTIYAGDLQFMTAGKGIIHAEMPHDDGQGSTNIGIQLWVDLPKELKYTDARYRDLRSGEIPIYNSVDGKISIKVISGQAGGVDSPKELAYTPVWLLDATIQPGGTFEQRLPTGWNAFAYSLNGSVNWDTGATTQQVDQYHITVFEQRGDQVKATVSSSAAEAARILLVAGSPLDQPVVQYGPFVMTSQQDVRQAMYDFQTQQNGFERAQGWESEIGRSMM